MNEFWRSAGHSDDSQLHGSVCFKVAERLDPKCSLYREERVIV